MMSRSTTVYGLAILLLSVIQALGKEPPPPPRLMPGDDMGSAEAGWLAPYVHFTSVRARVKVTTVRWFSTDGKVRREVSGTGIGLQTGFVWDSADGRTVWGLSGDWKLVVPEKGECY